MKCPKCDYLGFDTGDRCRNCGYDFSLLAAPAAPVPDLPLREPETPAAELPPLPLFARGISDDEPLIKVPSAPRAPLAVRRTPEQPRSRAFVKSPRPTHRPASEHRHERLEADPELALQFTTDDPDVPSAPPTRVTPRAPRERAGLQMSANRDASPVGRRILAALIDLTILLAIDLAIVYFTLRMAGLTMDGWRLLPAAPMLAFLAILKLAYFSAFTSIGGQTIGKMAARIQVVADDDGPLDPLRAVQRVLAGALSTLAFGLGFIPALIGHDRRPLHDRVARTRVVARSS